MRAHFASAVLAFAFLASDVSAQTPNERDGWRPRLGLLGGFTREHFGGDADNPEKDLSQSLAAISGGAEYVPPASRRVRLSVMAQGTANFRQRTLERRPESGVQQFSGSAVGFAADAGFQVAARTSDALDYFVGIGATVFRDSGDVERDPVPAGGARELRLDVSGHRLAASTGVSIRRRVMIGIVGEHSRLETHLKIGSGGTIGRPPTGSPPPTPEAKSAMRVGPRVSVLITRRVSAESQLLFANGYRFQIAGRYGLW